jgi:DNA-binding PadR family transcriptional regulator
MPFPGPAPWTRRVGPPDHLCFAGGPPADEHGEGRRRHGKGRHRLPRGLHRPFPGPHGGRRARRGDVRAAALLLLSEEPRNGYAIMQAIEERTGGAWRPSPGSVYPALAQLQDEGLVRVEEHESGRTFHLTEAGLAHVEERRSDLERRWRGVEDAVDEGALELMNEMRQLHFAVGQLMGVGTSEQVAEAPPVLGESRRAIYRMLAGDEPAQPPTADA